jgi:50S ribosomal protein L16 3-hydroxylase
MEVQRWLGEFSGARFVEQYFHRLPFALAGAAAACCELGQWETVGRILRQPDADALVCRRNEQYAGEAPRSEQEARELSDQGYTILIRHAERHDSQLACLAADFAKDFAGPVNVHIYATPASQYGFGWHYDAEDVFIVQTTGKKEYSLRKNTVNPWPLEETLPQDMRYGREIMPLMRCLLAPGDWLYIPVGYWHMGEARETAISLAIGVMSPTGIDVLDFARRQLLDSLRWRQRLPPAGSVRDVPEEQLRDELHELLRQLGDDFQKLLKDDNFLSSLLRHLRQADPGLHD